MLKECVCGVCYEGYIYLSALRATGHRDGWWLNEAHDINWDTITCGGCVQQQLYTNTITTYGGRRREIL